MIRVTIYNQSARNNEVIKFRLRDGETQLYHKTAIVATESELATLNPDGTIKPRTRNANRELSARIQEEMTLCREVYNEETNKGNKLTTASFEQAIDRRLHPAKYITREEKIQRESMTERLTTFADDALRFGVICTARRKHYETLIRQLSAFLEAKGKTSITAREFTPSDLADFRDYLLTECNLSQNTTSSRLKALQAFFNELEDTEEITKSPFRGVGKSVRRAMMRQTLDEPIYLTPDELETLARCDVPQTLRECKECFLLHCQLGARVEDFHALTLDNVYVTEDGIPFVKYIPSKTEKEGQIVETPLTRAALETIKRTGFKFNTLNYVGGKSGYNKKIGQLLQWCGIDRKVTITENGKKVQSPIYENASSKTARKTFVSAMARVQINAYASGLHKVGSTAVNHYFSETLRDRFILTCAAFGETIYAVDKHLNIIPA